MEFIAAIVLVFILAGSYIIGTTKEGIEWRTDCTKAGVHVSDGRVYECKERKA